MSKIIFPAGGAAAGAAGVSGANIGGGTQVWVSGIPMGDFMSPHTAGLFTQQSGIDLMLRADFAASGAAEKPTTSGTVVGAGTDLYVSGISVGDFLSPHTASLFTQQSGADLMPRASFAASGNAGGIPLSGTAIGASTQMWISGISVGDKLGAGGGNPIDARAATGDVDPNASGTLDMGSTTLSWGSGWFNGVVLTAETDGSQWALRVDDAGGLSTTAL